MQQLTPAVFLSSRVSLGPAPPALQPLTEAPSPAAPPPPVKWLQCTRSRRRLLAGGAQGRARSPQSHTVTTRPQPFSAARLKLTVYAGTHLVRAAAGAARSASRENQQTLLPVTDWRRKTSGCAVLCCVVLQRDPVERRQTGERDEATSGRAAFQDKTRSVVHD